MAEFLSVAYGLIKAGLWLPLAVLVIGGLGFLLIKTVQDNAKKNEKILKESAKKNEELLLQVINEQKEEAKEDKKSLMSFIENINNSLNDMIVCISGLQKQIEYNQKETNIRLDYIEKK